MTPHYILEQHKGHQWIKRPAGMNRLPSRYSYYDETEKVVEELNRLVDCINCMEKAGDEMAKWLSSPRNVGGDRLMAAEWSKAKEAKP